MSKGLSLHIGINQLNPQFYNDWNGKLNACEADAKAMEKIAKSQGFETHLLLTQSATRENVKHQITLASDQLRAGDLYFISYAGHGGQLPDVSGDETDGFDETWCLYNGQFLDDELTMLFSKFEEGVRVLLVSDSCHSGTIKRGEASVKAEDDMSPEGIGFRKMYPKEAFLTYRTNRQFYDDIKRDIPNPLPKSRASIKSITACRDDQSAADGKRNGFFTSNLLDVWDDGHFRGNYEDLFKKIESKMWWKTLWNGKKQQPVMSGEGPDLINFDKPFQI